MHNQLYCNVLKENDYDENARCYLKETTILKEWTRILKFTLVKKMKRNKGSEFFISKNENPQVMILRSFSLLMCINIIHKWISTNLSDFSHLIKLSLTTDLHIPFNDCCFSFISAFCTAFVKLQSCFLRLGDFCQEWSAIFHKIKFKLISSDNTQINSGRLFC